MSTASVAAILREHGWEVFRPGSKRATSLYRKGARQSGDGRWCELLQDTVHFWQQVHDEDCDHVHVPADALRTIERLAAGGA